MSHDPSEIILIRRFAAQDTFLIIINSLINRKFKWTAFFKIQLFCSNICCFTVLARGCIKKRINFFQKCRTVTQVLYTLVKHCCSCIMYFPVALQAKFEFALNSTVCQVHWAIVILFKKSCLYCWFPWQSFPIWSRDLEGGLLPVGECGNRWRRSTPYTVNHRYRTQT